MCAAVVLGVALLAPLSEAQLTGTVTTTPPATAPSTNPLGHAGVMPVPIGVSPRPAPAFPAPTPIGVPPTLPFPNRNGGGLHHHHGHPDNFFGGFYPVYVPVPVVVDPSQYEQAPASQANDDDNVVPGPTVFERRPAGDIAATNDSDAESMAAASEPPATEAAPAPSQPAQPQDPSVLVFRDGHQLEIQNYAIVGDMLYDFTPGHLRKVPLSQLDLAATRKANDERGVDFSLPASSANQ